VALQVDSLAWKADQRFQELSQKVLNEIDGEDLEAGAKIFIKSSGGITGKDEIEENTRTLKKGKKIKKKSTYLITKELIDQGFSLQEIAIQRNITEGTIVTHLIRISDMYPGTDLSRFKPSRPVMDRVKKARAKLLKDKTDGESISLKPIFSQLGGELNYAEIKLALVYL
jgi:uncharacterized protein YpbB